MVDLAGSVTPARRFALDVGFAFVGFALAAAAVVLLVEGAEQARWFEQLDAPSWLRFVLARWPARVAAVVPVVGAFAAGAVSARWEAIGAFASLEAAGLRPSRLTIAGIGAALVVGVLGVGVQEAASAMASREVAAQGAWVSFDRPDGRLLLRADLLTDRLALGVSGADVIGGRLGPTFRAARAERNSGVWDVQGAGGGLAADAIAGRLPDPEQWRARAQGAGPDASLATCWASRDLAAGRAWLAEAAVRLVACAALVGLAVPLGRRQWGAVGVVGLAVMWRVLQTGATAAAASGSWPLWVTAAGPLGLVIVLGVGIRWVQRRVG